MSKAPTYYRAANTKTGEVRIIRAKSNAQAREHLLKNLWHVAIATKDDFAHAMEHGITLESAVVGEEGSQS